MSLCVCLSCLAPQVALFHREHAQHECLQTDLSGFPDLSEEPSSLCKRFSSISWERDVVPSSTKTCSVSSGFPDRSQIGLGFGWVSLENLTRWTSPKDCWTSLPTGWCSTVEPNSSFPLVQLWYRVSMRSLVVVEETGMIFHIGLLQSSISQFLDFNELEVFPERKLHSILFDRMLILLWWFERSISTQNTASWYFFHAVCTYFARRGTEKSINIFRIFMIFYLLDQWARRILSVFCSNLDLQVSIHCW